MQQKRPRFKDRKSHKGTNTQKTTDARRQPAASLWGGDTSALEQSVRDVNTTLRSRKGQEKRQLAPRRFPRLKQRLENSCSHQLILVEDPSHYCLPIQASCRKHTSNITHSEMQFMALPHALLDFCLQKPVHGKQSTCISYKRTIKTLIARLDFLLLL